MRRIDDSALLSTLEAYELLVRRAIEEGRSGLLRVLADEIESVPWQPWLREQAAELARQARALAPDSYAL